MRKRTLAADLEQLGRLAFGRLEHCGALARKFWEVEERIRVVCANRGVERKREGPPEGKSREEVIWRVYEWLLAPLSLWPIDFEGLGRHVLSEIEAGRELDEALWSLLGLVEEPPAAATQAAVAVFEHYVQSGRYEKLLRQPEKFDEQEKALLADKGLRRAWEEIKGRFETGQFRNAHGVIRRRMSQERNLRAGWEFDWGDERGRFYLFFDAMCYRWKLYGMEGDRPLLLKVSVNPTPHGTMIVIPRHWSLDPRRDLDWRFVCKLHRGRGARRQGPKLSRARMERLQEARTARKLWEEAKGQGLHGEERYEYVRERMGRDARMNPGWLKKLLKECPE